MRLVGFIVCLLAYGSALHLHIDRQQTNIGPILGHMSTAQLEEHGPSHIIITDPQQEGEFYNVSADINDPNRFSAGILSSIGSGLAGMMTQWLGQLAGGMIPIIGGIGSSVAEAITGGGITNGGDAAEDNDPVEEDYPLGPASGAPYPVKPCKPKPTKPHKPFHKPLGFLVHVPQQGNYLVLHQPVQNSSQRPEKINSEQTGNKEQEGAATENKETTESTTVAQQITEEILQNNDNRNETIANV